LSWHETFDADPAVIYLLDSELKIRRCNAAWDEFAVANGGPEIVRSKITGGSIMDAVPPVLEEFYLTAYDTVRCNGREWWHVHMRILPSEDGGLLVINTLISEGPHFREDSRRISDYVRSDGVVNMCAHCRRVQLLTPPHTWDWIPELLFDSQALISHGLCAFCLAYHYHRSFAGP
jgi:hypothetical protein